MCKIVRAAEARRDWLALVTPPEPATASRPEPATDPLSPNFRSIVSLGRVLTVSELLALFAVKVRGRRRESESARSAPCRGQGLHQEIAPGITLAEVMDRT